MNSLIQPNSADKPARPSDNQPDATAPLQLNSFGTKNNGNIKPSESAKLNKKYLGKKIEFTIVRDTKSPTACTSAPSRTTTTPTVAAVLEKQVDTEKKPISSAFYSGKQIQLVLEQSSPIPCQTLVEPNLSDLETLDVLTQSAASQNCHSSAVPTVPLEERVCYEHFDELALLRLLSHPKVQHHSNSTVLPTLMKYLEGSKDGVKRVTYKRETQHKLGRLYGICSMQTFPRAIRHTIAGALYWDIDICNCHPQILKQLCSKYGISCPVLLQYVADRELHLESVMRQFHVTRDQAKDLFIRILYGGGFSAWAYELAVTGVASQFVVNLLAEMSAIQEEFWTKFTNYQKWTKDQPLPKASLLALVLGIEEDKILAQIVQFEERQFNRVVDVLVFDGCQIRRDTSNPLTTKELDLCAEWVLKRTGFQLQIIEKPMDEHFSELENCKPLVYITCRNEYDAACALRQIHGQDLFKFCDNTLFVFDKLTGLWNHEEKQIHQQVLAQYSIELDVWVQKVTFWAKLYSMLQSLSGDPSFLTRVQLSGLGKVLFQNGYFDFKSKTFTTTFDPKLFFPFRIERAYNPNRIDDDMKRVNQTLFVLPFENIESGEFVKTSLARAFAGCIRDKRVYFNIGPPNASKGVLTDALRACGERYVSTFNGGILQCQGDKDSGLRNKEYYENRWCRILFTNEMPMNKPIDGIFLKVISSGGDQMTGRMLFGNNSDFIPHCTTFVNGNDRPRIVPADDATKVRVISTQFPKTFVVLDNPETQKLDKNQLRADPEIKEKVKQAWFADALFHLIADAYSNTKSVPPAEVVDFSNSWTAGDDFLDNFKQDFEVTKQAKDFITNKEVVSWCEERGFKISSVKIGLELAKLAGVEKISASTGAKYSGLKRTRPNFEVSSSFM